MSSPSLHWSIVGGGMLGMTLAHRLAQRGQRVTLLEAADHLGGLADAWSLGDVTWDRHYHVTLLSDLHLRGLLTELGLESDLRWVTTRTGFYTDGKLHSMSNSAEFLRFGPLRLIDKLRLAWTIWHASRIADPGPLEKITAVDWLTKHSGQRTVEKIWLPLLRAKLGDNASRVSAAFIWATIARMYAARRSGLKREQFGYLPGGYRRINASLAELLARDGVEIRYQSPVEQVLSVGGEVRVTTRHGETIACDRAVLTIPSPLIAQVCPQLRAEESSQHQAIEYQGIICASLLMAKGLSPYYVTNITDCAPFTGVIEMTALVDPTELARQHLVYLPKYVTRDDPAWRLTDDALREELLAGLARMYPHFRRDDVRAFRVSRVRSVFALPTLDYTNRLPPMRTSVPGVYAVNSAQIVDGTLNVNETIRLAERALNSLLLPDLNFTNPTTKPHSALLSPIS